MGNSVRGFPWPLDVLETALRWQVAGSQHTHFPTHWSWSNPTWRGKSFTDSPLNVTCMTAYNVLYVLHGSSMFIVTYVPDGFQVQLFKEIRSQGAYLNFAVNSSSKNKKGSNAWRQWCRSLHGLVSVAQRWNHALQGGQCGSSAGPGAWAAPN